MSPVYISGIYRSITGLSFTFNAKAKQLRSVKNYFIAFKLRSKLLI